MRRNAIRLGIPHAHADDAVQEVFVTLVRRSDALGEPRSMRALLSEAMGCSGIYWVVSSKRKISVPTFNLPSISQTGTVINPH